MQLTCPRCFAAYNAPDAMFAAGPRKVRCSSCRFEWQESPMPQASVAAFAPPSGFSGDFVVPDVPSAPSTAEAGTAEPAKPKPARRGRAPEQAGKGLSTAAAWAFFVLATLACALVLLRDTIGHKALWLTDLYEAVGLPVEGPNDWFEFDGVALERNEVDGQINLTVRGKVINQSRKARDVPPLRLYWREKSGEMGPDTVLQARPARIAVGEAARFSGELRNVQAALGGEVKVTFVAKDDKPQAAPVVAPAKQPGGRTPEHKSAPAAPAPTHKEEHAPAPSADPHATGH
jgi:predicted Zn finger-like uncharacterized protein